MKPSKSEARTLSKLFPTTPSLTKVSASFDPGSACVFAAQKKKKKSARIKPSNINLVLLHSGGLPVTSIPRGKHRKSLLDSGCIKKIEFTREMTAQVVKNKIIAAFSGQSDFHSSYNLLSQSQDGRLSVADNQYPSGENFVEKALKHRGNVYLIAKKNMAEKEVLIILLAGTVDLRIS
jgi:hypothetical protein